MSNKVGINMLVKTIDRAIEQARDLGRPMTVHILMMAKIDVEQTSFPANEKPRNDTSPQCESS